jgi:hypothetical protein
MSSRRKALSPVTATIYVAVIGLVGTIGAAFFTNWDKLFGVKSAPQAVSQSTSQTDAVVAFQEEKYHSVIRSLDNQALLISGLKPVNKSADADSYLQMNKDTHSIIDEKYRELLKALEKGDNLRAFTLKSDMNRRLSEDYDKFSTILEATIGTRPGPQVATLGGDKPPKPQF